MKVLIQTETIVFEVEVNEDDKIETLINVVSKRTEYKPYQFELTFFDEILLKNSEVGKCGIYEESFVHMKLLKELKFFILFDSKEFEITIPNNFGITIQHLIVQIKKHLSDTIPELNEKAIKIKKDDRTLLNTQSVHSYLSNKDFIELVLVDPSKEVQQQDEETLEYESLLKNFVETSISSDVEIVFCFDTTGSMNSIINKVREQVETTVSRLMNDIPNIKIGIMGLGDYCDGKNVLNTLDLTQDVSTLCTFVKRVPATGGGDAPEAYEWALRKAKELSWSKHTSKAFVLIGDCEPHEPSYTNWNINWFEECDDLYDMGVKIYAVKALGNCVFYDEIAERTGGICITFNRFNLITDMFLAICYREASKEKFNQFENEIKKNTIYNGDDGATKEMSNILNDIKKEYFTVVEKDKQEIANNNNSNENIVVKQRGIPIKMRSDEAWFNHSKDVPKENGPPFLFNEELGHFLSRSSIPKPTPSTTSITDVLKTPDVHSKTVPLCKKSYTPTKK